MVTAAVSDVDGLEASDIEIRRGGASYTADTLEALHADEPDAEVFLVLGSDAAGGLPTWERADEVRQLATVVVVTRPGAEHAQPPDGWSWVSVESPRLEVSSTDLRRRVADGRPLDYLLTPSVIDCIRARGLYR
jgi:nicotinate-nucleotide adenylyltransferase